MYLSCPNKDNTNNNGFRHLPYDERLQKLELVKIENRFKRNIYIELSNLIGL